MRQTNPYKDFTDRLRILAGKHPHLITTMLSNIFPTRLIGNKMRRRPSGNCDGRIHQSMHGCFPIRAWLAKTCLYGAKFKEEFTVRLKASGDGPLQLFADKNFRMFPRLEQEGGDIVGRETIARWLANPAFSEE